jgi:hypothetical protein
MEHSAPRKEMQATLYLLILAEFLSLLCDLVSVILLYKKLYLARTMIESLVYVVRLV